MKTLKKLYYSLFPRDINTLLKILLEEVKSNYHDAGLCVITKTLYCNDIISDNEVLKLHDFIHKHMPKDYSYDIFTNGIWGWHPSDKQSRIHFLNKHIKK